MRESRNLSRHRTPSERWFFFSFSSSSVRKGRLRIFGFLREVIERIECGTLGKIGRILLRGFSETVCVDVGFKDIFNRDYFNCG